MAQMMQFMHEGIEAINRGMEDDIRSAIMSRMTGRGSGRQVPIDRDQARARPALPRPRESLSSLERAPYYPGNCLRETRLESTPASQKDIRSLALPNLQTPQPTLSAPVPAPPAPGLDLPPPRPTDVLAGPALAITSVFLPAPSFPPAEP